MNDTERLAIATSYPHDPPKHSFLFAGGLAYELIDPGTDLFVNGRIYVGNTLLPVPEALKRLGIKHAPEMKVRKPVLAHGSNASPKRLAQKFVSKGPESVIPVVRAVLENFDVVYSAHFSRSGSIPATLAASPGTRITIAITYLTASQLACMHESEIGKSTTSGNYLFGLLRNICLRPRGFTQLDEIPFYLSRHGMLGRGGLPIALASISAVGRKFPHATPREVLSNVVGQLFPEGSIDDFLLRVIDDKHYRDDCSERLRERALANTVTDFVKLNY